MVSGKALRHATIHRAAHRYFYESIGGIKSATILFDKLKIGYKDNEGTGVNWGDSWFELPTIKIHGKDNNGAYWDSNQIFSTTVHEIAHSTHMNVMGGNVQFIQVSKIIRESWPEAVQWFITRMEYNERGVANYDRPQFVTDPINNRADHKQWWDNTFSHDYTPVFIDLVDNFNQTSGPVDNVPGYTMQGIEGFLTDVYVLSSLKEQLKANRPTGITNQDIDNYLAYYFNL